MDPAKHWLTTDELTEAVKSLSVARRHLAEALVDPYELKWASLALVQSAQGFIVSSFFPVDVASWDDGKYNYPARMAAWEQDRTGPIPDPMEARLPAWRPLCERYSSERGYQPGDGVWRALLDLGEFRDTFIHYRPHGLAVQAERLRSDCAAALDLIHHALRGDYLRTRFESNEAHARVQHELRIAQRHVT
jgi:hypothetical protein